MLVPTPVTKRWGLMWGRWESGSHAARQAGHSPEQAELHVEGQEAGRPSSRGGPGWFLPRPCVLSPHPHLAPRARLFFIRLPADMRSYVLGASL